MPHPDPHWRQTQQEIHQIKQNTGCMVTLMGLLLIVLTVILFVGCDTVEPKTDPAVIERVRYADLSCPRCEPVSIAYVQVGGDFYGQRLVAVGGPVAPEQIDLPATREEATREGMTMPQVVYVFRGITDTAAVEFTIR